MASAIMASYMPVHDVSWQFSNSCAALHGTAGLLEHGRGAAQCEHCLQRQLVCALLQACPGQWQIALTCSMDPSWQ